MKINPSVLVLGLAGVAVFLIYKTTAAKGKPGPVRVPNAAPQKVDQILTPMDPRAFSSYQDVYGINGF